MSVLTPVIDYVDWTARRIYLLAGVTDFFPIEDIYHEIRNIRRTDESARKFSSLVRAEGNISKGGGAFTPRYVVLIDGAKLVPFNDTLQINQLGDMITDDPDTDATLYDISSLTVAKPIFIKPSEAETIQLNSESIVFSSFQGAVWVDINSTYDDVGSASAPNGNTERPVNTIALAVDIAATRGFNTIQVIGSITLDVGDDVRSLHLVGTSHINSTIVVNSGASCLETRFSAFDITGTLDGDSEIKDCVVRSLVYFNGHIHDSYLIGTISLSGSLQANISNCKILDVLNPPVIDAGGTGQNLMMPNYSGRVIVDNLTGDSQIAIGLDAGEVEINPTCTSGIIAISGNGRVIDNSSDGCYVVDTTVDGSDLQNMQQLIENLRPHHTGSGNVIYWNPYGGNDGYDGGHPQRATKTFAQAHNLAYDNHHDIIICIAGDPSGNTITTENCVITKNYLFVRSMGRDFTVNSTNDLLPAFDIQSNGVEISSMQVTTSVTNTIAAIKTSGKFPLLKDLYIGESSNGILINGGEFGIIDNCRVSHGSGYGVRLEGASEHFNIKCSHIGSNADDGIQLAMTSGHEVFISETVIHGNGGYGVDIGAGSNVTIINDDVTIFDNALGSVRDLGSNTHDASDPTPTAIENADAVWADSIATDLITEVQFIERWIHVDTEQLTQGIGTQKEPFNTLDAALTYMEANNLLILHTVSDLTLDRTLKNFVVIGIGNPAIDQNSQDIDGSEFRDCTLKGQMTGVITADNCDLFDNVQVQGRIRRCAFLGTVDQIGSTNYEGCYSGVKGHDYPTLKVTGGDAGLRGFIGSINVTGVTSGEHSIGISTDGRIIVDAACTGGHVHLRGFPFEIIDNSDIGCLVFDETESQKGRELHEASFNRRKHDSGLNTITIYESDDVTPKHVFDTNADLSDITPQ